MTPGFGAWRLPYIQTAVRPQATHSPQTKCIIFPWAQPCHLKISPRPVGKPGNSFDNHLLKHGAVCPHSFGLRDSKNGERHSSYTDFLLCMVPLSSLTGKPRKKRPLSMSPDMAHLISVSLNVRSPAEPKTSRSQSHSLYCSPLLVFAHFLSHQWLVSPDSRVACEGSLPVIDLFVSDMQSTGRYE